MRYFDCIQQQSSFSNLFEDYFYLDGISGKLGFRRLKQVLRPSSDLTMLKIVSGKKTHPAKQFVLTTIKIISYCTLAIPLIMLIGKAIERAVFHRNHKIKVVRYVPLSSKKLQNAERLIKKLHSEYFPKANFQYRKSDQVSGLKFSQLRRDSLRTRYSPIHPDSGKNSLVKHYTHDPDVLFLTDEFGNEISVTNSKISTTYLTKMLKAAFNTGKKIVVARLGNRGHCYLVAFDHTGKFKIIDSLSYNTFDVKSLEASLNKAKIKTKEGVPITFKGSKDTTDIQKGGHMCVRFSTLFGYQILKEKDINAYKKVVGAFKQKILKKFSDISHIDNAPAVNTGYSVAYKEYIPFMRSWGSQICLGIDDWKDFSLNKLSKISIIGVYHDRTPSGLKGSKRMLNLRYLVQGNDGIKTSLDDYSQKISDKNLKVRDVIPTSSKSNVYIYYSGEGKELRLAKVPSHLKVIRTFSEEGGYGEYNQDVEELFNQWG